MSKLITLKKLEENINRVLYHQGNSLVQFKLEDCTKLCVELGYEINEILLIVCMKFSKIILNEKLKNIQIDKYKSKLTDLPIVFHVYVQLISLFTMKAKPMIVAKSMVVLWTIWTSQNEFSLTNRVTSVNRLRIIELLNTTIFIRKHEISFKVKKIKKCKPSLTLVNMLPTIYNAIYNL